MIEYLIMEINKKMLVHKKKKIKKNDWTINANKKQNYSKFD